MKVEVIEWTGMRVGQVLDLPNDLSTLLIEQGKVKSLEDVKVSKRSRNKSGDIDLGTSESLVEGDENA
jgi:sporulation protein YlmC with PRC-barrel domain